MPDSTPNPLPPGVLPVGVERKDSTVLTQNLDPVLLAFLARAGLVHLHLSGYPLVVTSGTDGKHAANSKHASGKAVDLRITDMGGLQFATFLLAVVVLAREFGLAVFDQSMLPGAGHVHVEIAG